MGKEHWAIITHKDTTPGPGAYDVSVPIGKDALKYTIRKRIPEKIPETANVPMLKLPDSLSNRAAILPPREIPNSAREKWQTPGPSYIPEPLGKKPVSARDSIKRQSFDPPKLKVQPSYGQNPFGPAEYNLRIDPTQQWTQISIGEKPRDRKPGAETPGPDTYSPRMPGKKNFSRSCSFGGRKTLPTQGCSPGPIYKVESDFGKKSYVIHEKAPDAKAKFTAPGPGAYDLPQFGADVRPISIRGGKYHEKKKDDIPYYSGPSSLDKSKGKTIGRRNVSSLRRKKEIADSPGPGSYSPRYPSSTRSHKIAKPMKFDKKRKEDSEFDKEPGPDTYYPNYFATKPEPKSWSFKDNCGAESIRVREPCPPYYDLKDGIGSNSPRFTFHQRTKNVERLCFTKDAGYYLLPPTNQGPYISIHLKNYHDLAPE